MTDVTADVTTTPAKHNLSKLQYLYRTLYSVFNLLKLPSPQTLSHSQNVPPRARPLHRLSHTPRVCRRAHAVALARAFCFFRCLSSRVMNPSGGRRMACRLAAALWKAHTHDS